MRHIPPAKPKIRICADAKSDLIDIRLFSNEQFECALTDIYFRGCNDAFALLRRHPQIGIAEPDLGEGVRSWEHRSHRI